MRLSLLACLLVCTACAQPATRAERCPWRTAGDDPLDLRVCTRVVQVERPQDYCRGASVECHRVVGGENVIYVRRWHPDAWGRWEADQALGHGLKHAMGYRH